ncbi:MAG: 16S rRNA (guanine(966)-N(2))-methyltransferase RsmD [Thiogranum sp.]|nr:16S rRNA (guanine(966)-N(2))-methyltransferase RsmD [Thiogranum sp.]
MRSRSNQVRIIAGRWRGRKLDFPSEQGLRPTSDRIRETLFNWLAPALPGASCLDLFAGSGALGFEAASRGAAQVVMVEPQAKVAQALRENRRRLGADCVEIVQSDAETFLSGTTGKFDVVFVDPPFDDSRLLAATVRLLGTGDCLKPGARIYLEMPKKAPPPAVPEHWSPARRKIAGQVSYQLYCSDVEDGLRTIL